MLRVMVVLASYCLMGLVRVVECVEGWMSRVSAFQSKGRRKGGGGGMKELQQMVAWSGDAKEEAIRKECRWHCRLY